LSLEIQDLKAIPEKSKKSGCEVNKLMKCFLKDLSKI